MLGVMKALKAASQLEYNEPGCVVSVRIPTEEVLKHHASGALVEINCKSLFNKLAPAIPVPTSQPNQSADGPVFGKPLMVNRYDNIIDQLERKYYCGSVYKPAEDENSDSDESEAHQQPAEQPASPDTKPAKKKKRVLDDYDMDDPFIDDEDMIYEVEAEIKKSRTKTKHDGFFVSAGKLEVLSPKKVSKVTSTASSKAQPASKSAGAIATVPVAEPTPAASVAPTAPTTSAAETGTAKPDGEAKKRKRRTKKEMEEAAQRKATKKAEKDVVLSPSQLAARSSLPQLTSLASLTTLTSSALPSSSVGAVVISLAVTSSANPDSQPVSFPGPDPSATQDGPPGTQPKPKVEKEKEAWKPNEQVLQAIAAFRKQFVDSGIKLAKSSNIPKSLEEPLHEVDVAVLQHLSADTLARTSGYYEGLQEAMGGEVPTGKIRSLMVRLRLRDRAVSTLEAIEAKIEALMADLKRSVAPCPEKMQPSFKAEKRKEKAQSKAAAESAAGAVAGAAADTGSTKPEPSEKDPAVNATEGSALPAEPAILETAVAQSLVELQATALLEKAATEGPGSPTAVAAGPGGTGASAAAAAPAVRYEWMCNWTRPMKEALCHIEHALKLWVVQENQYREKLTVHDKKYMEEKDTVTLVEKDVVTGYLELICSELPPSCLQGNVSYMRKVISMLKVDKGPTPAAGTGATGAKATSTNNASASAVVDGQASVGIVNEDSVMDVS